MEKNQKGFTGNFFTVDNRIFDMQLKPRDIAVYCCLCRHINRVTGVAYPARRTIARECGISKPDTVDRALKVLCEKGLITKHHQYLPQGGNGANVYAVTDFGDPAAPETGYKQENGTSIYYQEKEKREEVKRQ